MSRRIMRGMKIITYKNCQTGGKVEKNLDTFPDSGGKVEKVFPADRTNFITQETSFRVSAHSNLQHSAHFCMKLEYPHGLKVFLEFGHFSG